jgi:hypothetical protein
MLSAADKRIDEAEDDLTYLWRSMLRTRRITEDGFNKGLNLWLIRNINEGTIKTAQRSSIRGNLIRALSEPTMTWKTFLRGMSILRVEAVRFQADVHFPLGVVERHETVIDSSQFDSYEATSEEVKPASAEMLRADVKFPFGKKETHVSSKEKLAS